MAFLHRKNLKEVDNCIHDHFDRNSTKLPPPSLPQPPQPQVISNDSLSPALIFMFCVLAGSFTFICYVICTSRYRLRQRNHGTIDDETHEDYVNQDLGPVTLLHPIWLINTIGLDQSQIESIHVFKYKKDEKLVEGTDCSVCLSEFEEDESLRLLPKCSHAFHVPCIDTWLRSHKNCPLCRAPIINNANNGQTHEHVVNESSLVGSSSTSEETETSQDSETIDDHHVVEVENKRETIDLVDHQDEELVTMRRSFSNNQLVTSKKPSIMPKSDHKLRGSSSSAHISHKVMKSSSFGHSIRKASSFTSKSRTLNQSY